ncbi:MAG: NUDIX domain-containing protein [archaeon]
MPQEYSLGIILVNRNNFLLLRRFPGHWSFLKASLLETDDKIELSRRTVLEETGIKTLIQVKNFQENEEYFFKKQGQVVHKDVVFLIFETNEEQVTLSNNHLGYVWIDYDRAMSRITFKPEKEILKKAYEHLKYNK